jgi:Transcriptional Coactivator p15 (PC4)
MSGYRKTDRQMPARQCPIAENEPIEIAKFWKSDRDRKNSIVVSIKQYEGHVFLDCRLYGTNAEGQTVPTAKGVTVGMKRLKEFLGAVNKAHAKAIALGLLLDDNHGEAANE